MHGSPPRDGQHSLLPPTGRVPLRREDRAAPYLPGESPLSADGFLQSSPVGSEAGGDIPQHPRSDAGTQCHPPAMSPLAAPGCQQLPLAPDTAHRSCQLQENPAPSFFLTVYDFCAEIHVCVRLPVRKLHFSQKAKRLIFEMTKGRIEMQ